MSEFTASPDYLKERAAEVQRALSPGGVLNTIASEAISTDAEITSSEAADIIMPPKQPGDNYEARWELVEGASEVIKSAAETRKEEIYWLAERLHMLKSESIDEADLARIDKQSAVWMVEGGANRTSVVRRELAIEAMRQIYGEQASWQDIFQFGSDRPIPRQREVDGEIRLNAEFAVAQEIAPDFISDDFILTEFHLNVVSAMQAGYQKEEHWQSVNNRDIIENLVVLTKADSPRLLMIQPKKVKGGLVDGINAVYEKIMRDTAGTFVAEPHFQPVIATNGQYRAKDELQADVWAKEKGINILPPVALGDEPGYTVEHSGRQIVTAERAPMAYVNETVVLHRLQDK